LVSARRTPTQRRKERHCPTLHKVSRACIDHGQRVRDPSVRFCVVTDGSSIGHWKGMRGAMQGAFLVLAAVVSAACGARSNLGDVYAGPIAESPSGGGTDLPGDASAPGSPSNAASASASASGAPSPAASASASASAASSASDSSQPPDTTMPSTTCASSSKWDQPDSATTACWACESQMCAAELSACAADCACSDAFVPACETDAATPCIPFNAPPNQNLQRLAGCLGIALSASCPCGATPPVKQSLGDGSTGWGCTLGGGAVGGGWFGHGQCTTAFSETCDGTTYSATCACPAGTCVCSGSGKVVNFATCPYCPNTSSASATMDQIFALCGFPH
jgi:hypothetical protein